MMRALGFALMVASVLPALWWLAVSCFPRESGAYRAEMLSFAQTLTPLILATSVMQFGMIFSFLDYRAGALGAPYYAFAARV